jgi:hypothetical protein
MRFIPLTNVEEQALIDDQDWELAAPFTWRSNRGYATTAIPHPEGGLIPIKAKPGYWRKRQSALLLSRLIMGLEYGDPREVDHDNHDTLDNRRSNLIVVTQAENHQNRLSLPGSSSRYRGVCWDITKSKWHASVRLNGKKYNLGLFTSEEEAARVAAEWRAEHMPHSTEARYRSSLDV